MYAMPQGYTVSARPGALNYIEGNAFIDGRPVSDKGLKSTFLPANAVLSTDVGKAEVLLTPGVFLRIGDNSAVKMISPSLTNTQVEVTRGEAMVEVAGLMKDNDIQVLNHNATIRLQKDGLYRFIADPPSAAVLEGKAEVLVGAEKVELGKGHEAMIADSLKAQKFDTKKEDDLYAWSNVRSEYDAAASYQTARNVPINNYGGWWGYGFGGYYSPGWFWNNGFDSWAWLPAYGAFYSPFGWGFYAPGVVGYAPVVTVPVYGGGNYWKTHPTPTTGAGTTASVPVNPKHPPALNAVATRSPAAYEAARSVAAHSFAATGFNTANGHVSASQAASRGATGSAASANSASIASGGMSAHSTGGMSGGGHAGGGGSAGGASHR
jgi:hypothetical protein